MVADHFFGGNAVFVDHGDGLVSQYFHLSRVDVAEGQELARGARVGEVGRHGPRDGSAPALRRALARARASTPRSCSGPGRSLASMARAA